MPVEAAAASPTHPARGSHAVAAAGIVVAAALYTVACPPYQWACAAWAVPGVLLLAPRRLAWGWGLAYAALFSLLMGWGVEGWAYRASFEYFAFNRLLSAAFAAAVWLVYGGIPYGVTLAAWLRIEPGVPARLRAFAGAWLWVVAELLRTWIFTGMPWELVGHSQYRFLRLVQIADLGGVPAVSFVVALTSVAGVDLVRRAWDRRPSARDAAPLGGALALVVAVLAYGTHRLAGDVAPADPDARMVTIVQGNVPNEFRWKRAYAERTLATYAGLSGSPGAADLIVWPENAADVYLNREPLLLAQIGMVAARAREGLLIGGPRLTDDNEARNSAYLIDPAGAVRAVYDKQHLVPLAEYDPFRRPQPGPATEPVYGPGPPAGPVRTARTAIGALICYEVLFPDLVRDAVRSGAEVLVNLSNDGWLDAGDGAARAQHFSMAVFRAIETRRFLVRAAATGVSGFIDPAGRMYATVAADRSGASTARVGLRHGETPYVRWGDAWVAAAGALLLALVLVERRRATR